MNNKLNNMINDFLANTDAKSEEELNEKIQEFIAKLNNNEIEYLNRINKTNPNFIKFFKGNIKLENNIPDGYYSKGDSSEVYNCLGTCEFLLDTVPALGHYVLENSKKKNK